MFRWWRTISCGNCRKITCCSLDKPRTNDYIPCVPLEFIFNVGHKLAGCVCVCVLQVLVELGSANSFFSVLSLSRSCTSVLPFNTHTHTTHILSHSSALSNGHVSFFPARMQPNRIHIPSHSLLLWAFFHAMPHRHAIRYTKASNNQLFVLFPKTIRTCIYKFYTRLSGYWSILYRLAHTNSFARSHWIVSHAFAVFHLFHLHRHTHTAEASLCCKNGITWACRLKIVHFCFGFSFLFANCTIAITAYCCIVCVNNVLHPIVRLTFVWNVSQNGGYFKLRACVPIYKQTVDTHDSTVFLFPIFSSFISFRLRYISFVYICAERILLHIARVRECMCEVHVFQHVFERQSNERTNGYHKLYCDRNEKASNTRTTISVSCILPRRMLRIVLSQSFRSPVDRYLTWRDGMCMYKWMRHCTMAHDIPSSQL